MLRPNGVEVFSVDNATYNQIVSFIWGIADDCLRDVYVRGKYRESGRMSAQMNMALSGEYIDGEEESTEDKIIKMMESRKMQYPR